MLQEMRGHHVCGRMSVLSCQNGALQLGWSPWCYKQLYEWSQASWQESSSLWVKSAIFVNVWSIVLHLWMIPYDTQKHRELKYVYCLYIAKQMFTSDPSWMGQAFQERSEIVLFYILIYMISCWKIFLCKYSSICMFMQGTKLNNNGR